MNASLMQRLVFLFIALNVANASRWWRDTGYDDALDGDAPEPRATSPPKHVFQAGLVYPGISPLNRTTGSGIYNLLTARQEAPGCGACGRGEFPLTCCNNGTYCCAFANVCQDDAGWCCPRGERACPGVRNVCYGEGERCCGDGVCPSSYRCCGGRCCPSVETICTADGQCISNQAQAASISSVSVLSVLSVQSVASVASQTNSSSSSSSTSVGEEPSTSDTPSSTESSTSTTVDSPVDSPTSVSEPPASSSSDPVEPSVSSSVSDSPTPSPSDSPTIIPSVSDLPTTDPSVSDSPTIEPSISDSPTIEPSISDSPTSEPSISDSPTNDPSVSDVPTFVPFQATVSIDFSSPSEPAPVETFSAPVESPPPAADVLPSSSSVVLATSVSNGITLTVSRTVAPHVATNNNAAATSGVDHGADAGDVVADVYPWDPRIVYAPEGAWVSTTSESSVGNCHNGTRVATIAGASITFPFEGKQIAALICNGSKGGDYSIQVDGTPAVNLSGYKDPNVGGDECILAQAFNSGSLEDGSHTISIIVKGSNAASASGGTAVEFGGFIYRGPHAFGTDQGSRPNIPAIVGGTVGGVVGGILIITLIVVIVIRKRRNRRVDDAPAVHNIPVSTGTPYSAVPTTEYHDPYASSGYGPSHYPNPMSMSGSPQPAPAWRQTNQGPFGSGSFAAGH